MPHESGGKFHFGGEETAQPWKLTVLWYLLTSASPADVQGVNAANHSHPWRALASSCVYSKCDLLIFLLLPSNRVECFLHYPRFGRWSSTPTADQQNKHSLHLQNQNKEASKSFFMLFVLHGVQWNMKTGTAHWAVPLCQAVNFPVSLWIWHGSRRQLYAGHFPLKTQGPFNVTKKFNKKTGMTEKNKQT